MLGSVSKREPLMIFVEQDFFLVRSNSIDTDIQLFVVGTCYESGGKDLRIHNSAAY